MSVAKNNLNTVPSSQTSQTAGNSAQFAEKLDAIMAQLKQISSQLGSRNSSLPTGLPTGTAKTPAWQKPADEVSTVDIKQGDSLSKIAARNNTTIDNLMALNGIKNKNRIKAGRKIIIADEPNKAGSKVSSARRKPSQHVGATTARPSALAKSVSARDRDTMIRTVIGEANNQGSRGQEAVAHVLMNRASDDRFPSNLTAVAKQRKQFSAWNAGIGGNSLVRKYNPGSAQYERAAHAVDNVLSGQSSDPTGGATHYYSPAGMRAHVARGEQRNVLPRWLQNMNADRGAAPTTIGGHIFTGKARIG